MARTLPLLLVLAVIPACGLINPDPRLSGAPTAPISSGPHNTYVWGDIDPAEGVTHYRR